jgi:pilus assembly protein Flp/PilA
MSRSLKTMLKDSDGATAVEYAFIASAMGLMLIPVLPPLRAAVEELFTGVLAGFIGG